MAQGETSRRKAAGQFAGAGVAGLLLLCAFPPYSFWPAAPLGVAALFLAVRDVGVRRGALLGLLAGLTFFVPLLRWSGTYVGAVPWLLLAVSQAAFFAPLGAALALLRRYWTNPVVVAVLTACLWVTQEALRTRIPYGGFPWGRLAFSSADAPWIEIAVVGGAPLVTFVIALAGGLIAVAVALLLRERPVVVRDRRHLPAWGLLLAAAATVLAPGLIGPANRAPEPGSTPSATVAIIQGNVPAAGLDFNAERQAVLNNHAQRTHDLARMVRTGEVPRPDLVVWPENSSDIDPFADPAAGAVIDAAVRDVNAPVLVGAILSAPGDRIANTAVLWRPDSLPRDPGQPGERYTKRHPVPFAEYIPLRSLARRVSTAVDLVRRDQIAGESIGMFSVDRGEGGVLRFGDVICFEVGYDRYPRDVVRAGAELLTVQTNNATFGFTPQTEQQLVMSRLRAIEHDRATLVAATSGVSAVIEPGGRIVDRSQLFTPDILVERVELRTSLTPTTRLGVAPEMALAIVGAASLIPAFVACRRGRPTT